MKTTEEITIKYLDLVIKDVIDLKSFSIKEELHEEHLSSKANENSDLLDDVCDNVSEMGKHLEYIKSISEENNLFELTEKGKQVKELGGHSNYLQKVKKQKDIESKIKNNFNDLTVEQIFKESDLSDIKIKNFKSINSKDGSNKKSFLTKFWTTIKENKWTLIIILLLIEELYFKTIINFIKSFLK